MSVEKRQSNPKLMVIGLDAATYDLIEPWVQQGLLPTFASLMSTGAYGPLKSVPNLNSASAWSSFATGQNPGKHGIFWFYERQTNSYEFRYHRGTDNTEPRFWEIFSNAGRSVAILNVPLSYPAAPLNGIMITGMLTPSTTAAGFTYPDTLRREIASIVPEYQIESDIVVLARSGRWDQAIQSLEKVAMARVRLAEYLLQRNSWDLFVTVFTALDRVQHVFWRHMSPNHPGYDPDISPRYQNTVLEFYQLLDQAIDKLLQHCDKDTYVVLVSDHGMGNNQMGSFFLNPLLERLGLFYRNQSVAQQNLGRLIIHWGARNIAPKVEGWIPRQIRKKLIKTIPGGRATITRELHQNSCDWSKTQVYTNYVRPELWINLQGREPLGTVEPGKAYESLREKLVQILHQCTDIETGKPLVRKVWKREQIYWGPQLHKAPDLTIDWNYNVIIKGIQYQDTNGNSYIIREQDQIVERQGVSGDHRPNGIFLLYGPNVKAGRVTGQKIIDVAPTVLYLAGLPIPQELDGSVIVEAMQNIDVDTATYRVPVTEQEKPSAADTEITLEDERVIEERLRSLGYL